MAGGELADVRDRANAVRTIHPVNADDVAAASADVRADERHQHVRSPTDERHVDGAADGGDRWRQPGREGRDFARLRIDAQDTSRGALGHVERAAGTNRAARRPLNPVGEQRRRRSARHGARGRDGHGGRD